MRFTDSVPIKSLALLPQNFQHTGSHTTPCHQLPSFPHPVGIKPCVPRDFFSAVPQNLASTFSIWTSLLSEVPEPAEDRHDAVFNVGIWRCGQVIHLRALNFLPLFLGFPDFLRSAQLPRSALNPVPPHAHRYHEQRHSSRWRTRKIYSEEIVGHLVPPFSVLQ